MDFLQSAATALDGGGTVSEVCVCVCSGLVRFVVGMGLVRRGCVCVGKGGACPTRQQPSEPEQWGEGGFPGREGPSLCPGIGHQGLETHSLRRFNI